MNPTRLASMATGWLRPVNRYLVLLSKRCNSSWAASSISLCRHSAARYTHAINPVR